MKFNDSQLLKHNLLFDLWQTKSVTPTDINSSMRNFIT